MECSGTYMSPEFFKGSDITPQFSNKMSDEFGDRLKVLYQNKGIVNLILKI